MHQTAANRKPGTKDSYVTDSTNKQDAQKAPEGEEKIDAAPATQGGTASAAQKPAKKPLTLGTKALIALIVVCLAGGIGGGAYVLGTSLDIQKAQNAKQEQPVVPEPNEQELPDNPIDFDKQKKTNKDIYGWITIDGTEVNYPVCQHKKSDEYYLTHNSDKEDSPSGAVFSEKRYNSKNFKDPVTVLYGHNGFGDTFFTTLHRFQDEKFFKKHKEVQVYAPGHIYTYKIVSAFTTDDRHLMTVYNFTYDKSFKKFLKEIQSPKSLDRNTRTVDISTDDKFLVLSTCNDGVENEHTRYLVCAVMTDDEKTK